MADPISCTTARAVNQQINSSTSYRCDVDMYARPDFWEAAAGQGDCEDFALAKRAKLIAQGADPKHLRLATCWTEAGDYHAVLIVTTTEGDYVLDNRHQFPMPKQDLAYRWDKIQEGATWHACS